MKSKFSKILSLLLVISLLLSMFTVFVSADEVSNDTTSNNGQQEEDTDDAMRDFVLYYNRTYDEGWDVKNGLTITDRGSYFTIDHELTYEGVYNYFWRYEVGSSDHSYVDLSYGATGNNGDVLEFDIKTDDITNIPRLVTFGTAGASASSRSDYVILSVSNNMVYVMNPDQQDDYKEFEASREPVFELTNDWTRFRIIFDYTYEKEPALEGDSDEEIARKKRENANWFAMYVYYGSADSELQLYNGGPLILNGISGKALQMVRIGSSGIGVADFGTSVCFDNLKMYTGVNKLVDITSDMGYGKNVNSDYPVTEEILGNAGNDEMNIIKNSLSMKVGVDYCYINGGRYPIATAEDGTVFGAPKVHNGQVVIPLYTVLEYIGYPYYLHPDGKYLDISTGTSATYLVVGKDTATVGSETVALSMAPTTLVDENGNQSLVIALSDFDALFPGYYSDYDDMGFMVISKVENSIDRDRNLSTMLLIMKQFVFDYASADEIYEDIKENTNNFSHPYLFADQNRLDEMHEEYTYLNNGIMSGKFTEETHPDEYWMWVHYERAMMRGVSGYELYAEPNERDEDGEGIVYDTFIGLSAAGLEMVAQPYLDSDGYDPYGGRSPATDCSTWLEQLTFAWAITRDIKYLQCAYEIAIAFGEWTHWGPGHFLNCADSSVDFALFYDWTYNGYLELNAKGITRPDGTAYDVGVLAEILYTHGVYEGYISTNGIQTSYISQIVGAGGSSYNARENNWNAVCTSGMAISAMAIMGENNGKYISEASSMMSSNLETLVKTGMGQYAPDGSYIESPTYWDYGTNAFFKLCAGLISAAGTDYGLMDTWGIDTTCYFALHSSSNDGSIFNFHDSSQGGIDTSFFFFVAEVFDDATICNARLNLINNNVQKATIFDLIYYPYDFKLEGNDIELDYYSSGIDLFATRGSWEIGDVYAAIMGGDNKVSHGQIDAGDFVYYNGGNNWIIDVGTENYNCAGFWPDATRYRYYVMKPEGNNTIALVTDAENVPYGQRLNSMAYSTGMGSNEYGSYVTYNMTDTLGGKVSLWERGMLLTNDRNTTVIQDHITFTSMQQVYWFAHYSSSYVTEVEISADGQTAYLKKYIGIDDYGVKQYQVLRVSLVTKRSDIKFQVWDTYTMVHTKQNNPDNYTYEKGEVAKMGNGVPENDRSKYSKLVIDSGMALEFTIAVVFELVDFNDYRAGTMQEIGYDYVDMNEWEPTPDTRGDDIVVEDTVSKRGTPNVNEHIVKSMAKAKALMEGNTAFDTRIKEFFRSLSDAQYATKRIGSDLPSAYISQKLLLEEYKVEYDKYLDEIVRQLGTQKNLTYHLLGMK